MRVEISTRTIFCTLLVVFEFLGHSVLILSMLGIEAFYGVYILAVRPFESKVNNLVECLNEVFFFCFIAYLIKFNGDNDWSKVYSDLYIQLMVGNGVIIVIILCSTGIVLSIKKCYLSGSKQTSEPSKVTRFNLQEVSASNVKLQLNRQRADPSTGVGMSRQELVKRVKKVVKGLSSSKKVTPVLPK